jgi:flagellar biosynthesis/type III secretory pathway chaperone
MQDPIKTQLDLVEQQFNQVAAFLANGDALQLQTASQSLQSLGLQLAKLLQASSQQSPAAKATLRRRVQSLASGLQILRDNLSRRLAYTEQALAVVVPVEQKSTYSAGGSVYGSVARQTGAFKVLAA